MDRRALESALCEGNIPGFHPGALLRSTLAKKLRSYGANCIRKVVHDYATCHARSSLKSKRDPLGVDVTSIVPADASRHRCGGADGDFEVQKLFDAVNEGGHLADARLGAITVEF